ncbi:glutathione S-transferase family protein [Halieaceae bacterium IMCC14734]|uniref:Glutathione S-transferase family protein n=1 Tax=Candidatus Litorirhabdus singularis TaxID=2518993 RepID=A0ABT3TDS9_9GAMM|nr:glutathione S-transferase family protein [Candidatus Litorirhabdus singularis]MCX2980457.1 glutathione S-transferase family protein [Candidatus Litorirhabdus singularis]
MITLHGFAASNYYNVVKHVLLYKQIPFEEHLIFSGGDEWLEISPVGKVPALTTSDGRHLSETTVICDYLEETYPERPLYPTDAGERAAVRQIMKISELYLELPARRFLAYAFSGKGAPEPVKAEVRHVVNRGVGALSRLCQFSPWIAGEEMTMADIYVHYVNKIVGSVGSEQLDWDILAQIPGMKEWNRTLRDAAITREVEAGRVANEPAFQAYIQAFIASGKSAVK